MEARVRVQRVLGGPGFDPDEAVAPMVTLYHHFIRMLYELPTGSGGATYTALLPAPAAAGLPVEAAIEAG